ncbi:hypothetical protein PAHAL_8G043900 [Panicum hallii]|uniref:Bowman-Birk serine protease inhibitors family domain-containing protein n=1 Tax=Panicum hallii TaxID=206008 RepID=A0A2S3ICV8_9POAL|nr:Bowman-Birk type wound-induced proteinase inhibitor WIP1-like [Panicum hallii]PAN41438.1 hypothetical protein PAHAL_8G043900 [Panicum hallii]
MKSSTLIMAIILVAQAVLIVGVFAAVSIENSSAGVGEEEVTAVEPQPNPGKLSCCKNCTSVSPPSGLFMCHDELSSEPLCQKSGCRTCQVARHYPKMTFKCIDEFNGTCPPRCSKS